MRFDIRAEREEYERLFQHSARVLQDRLARCGGGDRTKEIPVAEWERVYRKKQPVGMRNPAPYSDGSVTDADFLAPTIPLKGFSALWD